MTDATAPKILTERRGHVLLIAFNRPEKYNAFDLEMHHQLAAAYGLLDRDPELRCALVSANGKAFTAGLELTQWTPAFASGKWPDLADHERDPFGLIPEKRVSKPIIFAMHGICFTVAIELALAADIRVAAEDCRFGQIEVKRGIYAVGGGTVRMVQEFGWGNAQKYLLTGDEFNAAEALRIGLLIYDQVELLDHAGPYEVFTCANRMQRRLAGDTSPPPFAPRPEPEP